MARKQSAPGKKARTAHLITVTYTAGNPQPWDYQVKPPQTNPRKAKFKRGDTVKWTSPSGDWKVTFYISTPIVDGNGLGLASISGKSGKRAGGFISQYTQPDDAFAYGVSLLLPGASQPVTDDPEIIIDSDMQKPKAKKKPKPKK